MAVRRLIFLSLFFAQNLFAANLADPKTTPYLTSAERERALLIEKDLQSLGFSLENVINSIKKQQKISESQVQDLKQRYAIVDSSRQGAAVIFSFLESRLPNAAMENRLVELVARLMVYGIKGLPNQLPPEIENLSVAMEKQAQAEIFLKNYLIKAMNQTKNELLGDIASVFYTAQEIGDLEKSKDSQYLQEKAALDENISLLVQSMYLDLQQTHSRFFGRAMAQAFLRYANLQKRQDLIEQLKVVLKSKGVAYENVNSATFTGNDEGEETVTPLSEGTQIIVEKAFVPDLEGRWQRFKDAFKPIRNNEATGIVQVLTRADLGLTQVWIVGKNASTFTDVSGFAPPGVTINLWRTDKMQGRVLMASDKKSKEEARQLRFYGTTFFPLDAGVNAFINLRSQSVEASPERVSAIIARAVDRKNSAN
jgi:hypothetical protein